MDFRFKVLSIVLTCVFCLASWSTKAFSDTVELSETQNVSANGGGQSVVFSFTNVPLASATPAQFVLSASGDFVHIFPIANESLIFNIENVVSGGPIGTFVSPLGSTTITSSVGGPFDSVIFNGGIGSIEFQRTFQISAQDIVNITSDGQVDITVDLGTSVDSSEFVAVGLTFHSVPEPNSAVLFALAGTLLPLRRRRRGLAV